MRIEYIKIKNFKSIKDEITVKLSPNKTVIVGQNNAGKTNIITALDILFGERYPTYYPLEERDFFDPREPLEIEVKISEIDRNLDYSRIKWKERFKRTDKARITSNNGELFCNFKAQLRDEGIEKEYEIYVSNPFPLNNGTNKILSKSDEFHKSLLSFVFVPADRTIRADLKTGGYSWYGKLLRLILESQKQADEYSELVKKLEEIENLIKKVLKSEKILEMGQLLTFIEDLKFSLTKSKNPEDLLKYIEILVKGKTANYLELSRFGHGTQSAILIGLLELYLNLTSKYRDSVLKVFAIDEPENFLHPQGKRLINYLLERISEEEDTQIIYATHSSELVTNFEEGKFTLEDIVYVYREDGTTKVKQFLEEESKKFFKIQEELDVEKGEIFFASAVILVEGETEKHSIPLIYRYHSWSENDLPDRLKEKYKDRSPDFFDLDFHNISVVNMGGKDNLSKYFKFAMQILGRDRVAAIIDKDPDFEDNFGKKLKRLVKEVFNEESGEFSKYGIFVLPKGEFEHYYDEDIIKEFIKSKIEDDVKNDENINRISDENQRQATIEKVIGGRFDQIEKEIKQTRNESKLSEAYEKLFGRYFEGWTKPAIAFKLTRYLLENDGFDRGIFDILKSVIFHLKQDEV